jgi:hypothetical protein
LEGRIERRPYCTVKIERKENIIRRVTQRVHDPRNWISHELLPEVAIQAKQRKGAIVGIGCRVEASTTSEPLFQFNSRLVVVCACARLYVLPVAFLYINIQRRPPDSLSLSLSCPLSFTRNTNPSLSHSCSLGSPFLRLLSLGETFTSDRCTVRSGERSRRKVLPPLTLKWALGTTSTTICSKVIITSHYISSHFRAQARVPHWCDLLLLYVYVRIPSTANNHERSSCRLIDRNIFRNDLEAIESKCGVCDSLEKHYQADEN